MDDEAKKKNQNLLGMGGVFNTVNLAAYHYAGNTPAKYIDPDGRDVGNPGRSEFRDSNMPAVSDVANKLFLNALTGKYGRAAQVVAAALSLQGDQSPTHIYRFGSGTATNLTPREKDRDSGLSYTLKPPPEGHYTVTTMQAVNSTGVLVAYEDKPGHVSVMPKDPSKMDEWIASRPTAETNPHPLTLTLQAISTKE